MSLVVLVLPLPLCPSHPRLSPSQWWRGLQGLRARVRSGQRGHGKSSSLADAAGILRSRHWGEGGPSGVQGPAW